MSGHRASLLCSCALIAVSCAPKSEPATGALATSVRTSIESGTEHFDHALWDQILAQTTSDGLIDYSAVSSQGESLERYLASLAAVELATLAGSELKALLINAYNAYTVRSILDHPGITSIKEIEGVWNRRTHLVGGFALTLDEIEHNLLRPFFLDPRIHFAVNCASVSCAPLPPYAYRGENLEEQLEAASVRFLNDTDNVRLEGDTLQLSSYFDWYGDDFTSPEWSPHADSLAAFVAIYSESVRGHEDVISQIRFLEYDWSLNRAPGSSW